MNKKHLETLGLEEGATAEQIEEAYSRLKEKYSEERFLEGEVGNNAAKMLNKIEVAREELLTEISEKAEEGGEGGSFAEVLNCIQNGDLQEAQRLLDKFNERNAEWHYLQSVIFYRKNWVNESKKQLEIAMRLDEGNEKYKNAYKKLNDNINFKESGEKSEKNQGSVYEGQDMNPSPDGQMAGSFCASCAECCALNMCLNCLCNSCCRF